ncbi:hypothetical protein [Frigoribacterium sp. SL97]|uniref:hypothetical protein n=1 Tax=Frigoribacterium sp. SL97 TaxID=2994664 RepID=UPI00226E2C04|nr:hypothetical protein [Frigoribacterium sp. SL97]WAC50277.1 hypothetical protein OVA02_10280 [Frigoribacterium sp. SL97]
MTQSTLTAPAPLTATARGLIVGSTLLAMGIALGIYRFVTLSATTDSAFIGSLLTTAIGASILARLLYRATRKDPRGH